MGFCCQTFGCSNPASSKAYSILHADIIFERMCWPNCTSLHPWQSHSVTVRLTMETVWLPYWIFVARGTKVSGTTFLLWNQTLVFPQVTCEKNAHRCAGHTQYSVKEHVGKATVKTSMQSTSRRSVTWQSKSLFIPKSATSGGFELTYCICALPQSSNHLNLEWRGWRKIFS